MLSQNLMPQGTGYRFTWANLAPCIRSLLLALQSFREPSWGLPGIRGLGSSSLSCPKLTVSPQGGGLTSLDLGFLIWEWGFIFRRGEVIVLPRHRPRQTLLISLFPGELRLGLRLFLNTATQVAFKACCNSFVLWEIDTVLGLFQL